MPDIRHVLRQYETHQSPGEFHIHGYAHLVYVHKGCQIFSTDQHSLLSLPDSLVYIPANVPHRAECLKESQISLLKVPSHSTIKDITVLNVTPIVTQLFSVLKKAMFEPTLVSQYVDVLVDQCSHCEPSNQPLVAQGVIDRRMLLIIEALSGKPNIKMSISDLSKQTGASVRTLNRLFLTHFQASFKDIRNKVVMERAEQMIKQGTSATTVAYELKYSSLSSFSTAYSQHQKNQT